MNDNTLQFKEGDIFRWSYREPGDDRTWGRYHCCSRIAIFSHGRLRDTYWDVGSEGRSFGPEDVAKLDLVFLGNLSGLYKASEYEADYYDDSDIVNLNHMNSSGGNFYLRNGAKRSQAKMLASARRNLEKARSQISAAKWREEQALKAIERIQAGETEVFL